MRSAQYVHDVRSRWSLPRTYWLDALIVLLTITAVLELVFRRDSPRAPETRVWFGVTAVAIMVLPLFARRRFPFGAPAVYWLLAAGFSFVDGRLIPFVSSVYALGMTTAFLLGNVRDARRARIGLAVVLGAAVIIVYNLPEHTASQLLFTPLVFGISWLAGFALRERAVQAEAAEVRAAQAERERDAAARIAVAEERTRIARELHDIVAHAVSVMVLQVGAVRHGLPAALADDRDTLRGVEQVGRTALTEMRRLLAAMRLDGDEAEFMPHPGLDNLRLSGRRDRPRRSARRAACRRTAGPAAACGRPLRVPNRSRGPDQRTEACAGDQGRADPRLPARRAADRRAGRRRRGRARPTASATVCSVSANASRSTAAR